MIFPLGALGYFLAQLAAIVGYTELQPKVFQCLREIGNTTLVALKLEHAMVNSLVFGCVMYFVFWHAHELCIQLILFLFNLMIYIAL